MLTLEITFASLAARVLHLATHPCPKQFQGGVIMKQFVRLICILLSSVFFSCVVENGDDAIASSRLSKPVTFDGQITSSEEWADTNAYSISLNRACCWPDKQVVENAATMSVRFKNDDTWLYMLYKIAWPSSDTDSNDRANIALFTAPYGPPWAESDRGLVTFGGQTWDSYGWDDTQWYTDIDDGGQNDVEGAASHDGAFYWFEFRKKLDSGDGHDWSLQPPQTIPNSNGSSFMVSVGDFSAVAVYEQNLVLQLSE
jgi:hypothetical protein